MISVEYMMLFALVGSMFILWAKKRQFDRSKSTGVEIFNTFTQKNRVELFDGVLFFIGYSCLSASAFIAFVILLMDDSIISWIVIAVLGITLSKQWNKS